MRDLLIVTALIMLSLSTMAQDVVPCACDNGVSYAFEPKLSGELYVPQFAILGEEFFNKTYTQGDIVLQNGAIATDKKLRYNGRLDGLLMLSPQNQEIILDKYFIKEFCFKNYVGQTRIDFKKIRVIKPFSSDTIDVFGQVLYKNKLSLYAFRQYISDKEAIVNIGNYQTSRKLYYQSPIFYFQLPNHRTIGFKKFKKRALYLLFPEKREAMKKLFREHHQHRFKKEEDLIRIAELLNTIN